MERTLGAFLTDEPAPFFPVLKVFQGLLASLNAIHAARSGHQSLTPDSIRIDEAGQPIVQAAPSRANVSGATVVFTKTKYSAPDVFTTTDAAPSPCETIDSYLVGFMFYEILSGTRLFRQQFAALEDGPSALWLKWHLDKTTKARSIKELRPDIGRFAEVIDGMIEKDPAKRTKDLTAVAALLADLQEKTDQKLKAPKFQPPAPPPAPAQPSQNYMEETTVRKPSASQAASSSNQLAVSESKSVARKVRPPASSFGRVLATLGNPWLVTGALVGVAVALLFSAYFAKNSQHKSNMPSPIGNSDARENSAAKAVDGALQPQASELFYNPNDWTANPDGSFAHNGSSYSFLRPFASSMVLEFLTDASFALNYQSETQCVFYSMNRTALRKSVCAPNSAATTHSKTIRLPFVSSSPIRLKFQFFGDTITISAVPSGETLDKVRVSAGGRFGFSGPVTLKVLTPR